MSWIRELYYYRYFIRTSIVNEFRARFVRSRLGAAWMILNPLAQVVIFAFILSEVLSAKLPGIENKYAYAIYLMAGTVGWSLFAEIFNRCLTVFIDNGNTMKKLAFPKSTLPVIVVGSALVNNLLLLVSVIVIFAMLGHTVSSAILWLPFVMIVTIAFAVGLGLFLGVLNVFIRDIGQIMPIILQIWYWFTPVVYMEAILPKGYGKYIALNPMYPIISAYHNIFVFQKTPNMTGIGVIGCISAGLLLLAVFVYRRASAEMVDVL
ncbi:MULTISPECIES: ABC transporter permease [Desulfosporosinus]|uniref:Transport permease protein n=1 Tax=Desulfosporosinus lacus DSM 15449 TaxID=1121420 RepID=A0A1M5RY61_9FIRM|nr:MULTISPECIES: ABC transporter permease [Desulfosporosinus]MDA8221050.1 ABC transporter permease [Desulfitobacterium hafniense]SHH30968.1 lipopolysaccharide transport system permease protein [Desulfosporosinus lacus DSM 15449]